MTGERYIYTYDGEGNLTAAEDACGNQVRMEYDANGNLTKETDPLGASRSYTYTPLGDIRSVTDEAGRETRYSYYPGGQLKSVHHPDGTEESYAYDENGNVKTYTAPTGFVMSYEYDSLDRIVCIRGDEGESKHYTYDAAGNVTSMTDGLGNVTRYEYSLSGQLTKVTDALGNETEYSYDEADRLIQIRQYGEFEGDCALQTAEEQNQKKCQITRYKRNLRGLVEEVTDALGQKEHYQYDKKGQLLSKLDKEGYLTRYSYTRSGEISGIQYADGRAVRYGYNALRQLTEVQDWIGTIRIEPDAVGRAKKVTYPDGKAVSYTYGASGERTSLTYPDGRTVHYGYDRNLRLSEMKEGDQVITYAYDEAGRLAKKNFPNGMESSYQYDRKGQLLELCHKDREGILDRYTYAYDLIGNKTGITKERRGLVEESGAYSYGYDALGRLSEIWKDGNVQTQYGYDAFGNRIQKQTGTNLVTYTHNALNQLIKETDDRTEKLYRYDHRGNLAEVTENGKTVNQYVYGALNRLEWAANSAGEAAGYQYNGLGHRIGKTETKGAKQLKATPVLDPIKQLEAQTMRPEKSIEYRIDLTREYYNLLEKSENERKQTFFWNGNVSSFEENGEKNYYLQDELGSVLRIEDESGAVRDSYGYGAFGEDLYGNQGMVQPFGYTGYQKDAVTGTYYAQAREYHADAGRFQGRDLVSGFAIAPYTLNRYGYCFNSPVTLIDLNGQWPQILTDIGDSIKNAGNWIGDRFSEAVRWVDENIWSKYIYGEDRVWYETDELGGKYEVTSHKGGTLIVAKKNEYGEFIGWSLNAEVKLPGNITIGSKLSGTDWSPLSWKYSFNTKYKDSDTNLWHKVGKYIDKNGVGMQTVIGGASGTLPLPLPDGTQIDDYASLSWSLSKDVQIANWIQVFETVSLVAAAALLAVLVLDDGTIIGMVDNGFIAPVLSYIAAVAPNVYQFFVNLVPKLAACGG